MFCPYTVNRKIVTQVTREYNENGNEALLEQVESNTASYPPCLKEKCGAWENGGCNYYGEKPVKGRD